MFNNLTAMFSWRGRQGFLKSFGKQRQGLAQRYLTASDESAMGALTQIVKSETFKASKERHIDCNLTPNITISPAQAKINKGDAKSDDSL